MEFSRFGRWMLALMSIAVGLSASGEDIAREVLHGIEVMDEFRWLEGSDAPEVIGTDPSLDARVSQWTDAQNSRTREILRAVPGREELESRLRELMEVGQVSSPSAHGNRYFFLRREAGAAQWSVVCTEGVGEPDRVILDPNVLDPEGLTALGSFTPDREGRLAAFTLFKSGDENTTLYLLDVESREWLADEIPGKVDSVSWLPGGTGFVYHRLADVEDPYSGQVLLHRVGRHHRQDPVLMEQEKEGPLATTWGPFAVLSADGRWLLQGYWTGTDSNDLWVSDFDLWQRTGEWVRQDILVGEDARSRGEIVGNTLFLHTNLDAPNGRVLAIDLSDPSPDRWKAVIPERSDAVLESVSVAKGILAAEYLENASSRLYRFSYTGEPLGALDLPGIGSATLSASVDRTEAFLSFSSFDLPSTIYRVDLSSGERSLWARPDVPLGEVPLEVSQVWYPSKDGTRVSMFLVHRSGLKRDGKNPTILSGYGGFGISLTPTFKANLLLWMEDGGLLAVANLRGGGEYGQAWHQAGMLEHKQNVFDDFIAAGEWLIREGYTSRRYLGVRGGSNGGLLTGAALVQRPELFSAVVSSVPLLDMLRYQHFLMARYWVPEYGTSENPEHLRFLLEYSPYHNIKKGTKYPAVLLTAGENDIRVHPMHARKMAARLQAATAGDPKEDPILLWVDRSSGHGRGKPLDLQIQTIADELTFFRWQLGMTPGPRPGPSPKPGPQARPPVSTRLH